MFSQNNGFYNTPPQDNTRMGYQNPMMGQQNQYIPQPPNNLTNNYYPAYKQGGEVDMHEMAEQVREGGRGGDTVLAHINPMEQEILKQYGGSGTINPYTGLPEYGFRWSKILKPLARIGAAIVGTMYGGPAGGAAAASLVGASQRGKGNKLKGAMRGGLEGLAYGAVAPKIGQYFGVDPSGMMGRGMGMSSPSLMNQLGFAGTRPTGGGIGLKGLFSGAGGMGGNVPGQFMGMSPLKMGLGAAAIGSGLMSKTKNAAPQESIQEYMQRNANRRSAEDKGKRYEYKREYAQIPEGYLGMQQGEIPYFGEGQFQEIPGYAYGGAVPGDSGGQDDARNAHLSDGEYVHRADVVSRLGDGNTESGFKKLYKLDEMILRNAPSASRRLPKKSPNVNQLMKALGV